MRTTLTFKGLTFKLNKEVVTLPTMFKEIYVQFGKITLKGGVETKWVRINPQGKAVPVYATPIENDGYSLTNMMYGKTFKYKGETKRHVYLSWEGRVYTTTIVAKNVTSPQRIPPPYIPKEQVPDML